MNITQQSQHATISVYIEVQAVGMDIVAGRCRWTDFVGTACV